ncbi:MAG: RDD family protein [Rickettsiales bacterium]|nr:RDD family protein [Rickettsiales bacterium]
MSEEKKYAGFWVRFFAGTLDILFLAIPLAILFMIGGFDDVEALSHYDNFSDFYVAFTTAPSNRFLSLVTHAVTIAYVGCFLSSKQQATIGKRLLGIYVGNPDGSKLTWQKSVGRALGSIVTSMTMGLGFLAVIFTKEKISLHDFLCNTRVFMGKKND